MRGLTPSARLLAIALALAALGPAACRRPGGDASRVTVIGARPTLKDPADGPLTPAEALLDANVAQGLVRFDVRGQIDSGLAERWNVSDDGLSYIFRLQMGNWPGGRRIDAREVARILNRQLRDASRNDLKDTLGAVEEIVAMTDRVLEIRLRAPRAHLLQLLAQPEFAILRQGEGSGPFLLEPGPGDRPLRLRRTLPGSEDQAGSREEVELEAAGARAAVERFRSGQTDLVLGGGLPDLPLAQAAALPRGALRYDPVVGLFGLVPARRGGPLADRALRSLISRAIDRDALVAALGVDGLVPRTTLLQPGLDGVPDPVAPAWAGSPPAQRRGALAAEARQLAGAKGPLRLWVSLGEGPGGNLLFTRLKADLAAIGIEFALAAPGQPADLRLIDEVAPSTSPAWFVRRLRCDRVAICDPQADEVSDQARAVLAPQARAELLRLAAQRIDEGQLFIPLSAPIRWSLASADVPGFQENRFGHHTLVGLAIKPARSND